MNSVHSLRAVLVVAVLAIASCQKPAPTPDAQATRADEPATAEAPPGEEESVEPNGEVTRAEVEAVEGWSAEAAAAPDPETAKKLADVDPGATVEIYLGTWCGDSRREVPRFWRALDVAGEVPFDVRYVALDRNFSAGPVSLEGKNIEAVPTFVVYREGEEVGRVIERSVTSPEADVLSLLDGSKTGKISATR